MARSAHQHAASVAKYLAIDVSVVDGLPASFSARAG
jgi:hypothetical protein